jgi:hypothetical protein
MAVSLQHQADGPRAHRNGKKRFPHRQSKHGQLALGAAARWPNSVPAIVPAKR